MKVGLVCPYTWDFPGGVMAHVRDLAEALIEQGHSVSVLAPSALKPAELPAYVVAAGRPVPVPYNGSVSRVLFGPVSLARTRRWLREGGFDVLHVHEPTAPSISFLALASAKGPVVATIHTSTLRSRGLTAAEPILVPAMEKIRARIAVSPAARRTIVEHLGGDAVLIPNGVALRHFAAAVPLEFSVPTLVFLGRIDEPRKGLAVLLEAFAAVRASIPQVELVVAGPGEAFDAVDGVRYLGLVDETTKASLLAGATVYVAPNLGGESFGIVLLEAMAAGAPVVAADLDAFSLVLDGHGVLTPVGDAVALAAALVSLLGDPARRSLMSDAGRVRASVYDWATVSRQVVAVYETVVDVGHVQVDPVVVPLPPVITELDAP